MSIDLTNLTTFKTAAKAKRLIALDSTAQLNDLPQQLAGEAFIILGGGSNVLFADDYDGTVIVNRLRGQTIVAEDDDAVSIRLGAGENWHDCVCALSARGFYGLENLALIPGTIGAAPVQNIGAYGVEVADFIERVEVFNLTNGELETIAAADCQFAYRDSIFKCDINRNRYLITAVILRLSKHFSPVLTYQGLAGEDSESLTAEKLLARVIAVRQSKLPNPDEMPNAGSFFKNPVIARKQLESLQKQYENIPFFDVDAARVKVPAAWLLETAGFKGEHRDSGAGVYEKHALILVNRGQAHGREIYALACDMMETVENQFGISIVPEVRIVGIEPK